MKPLVTVVITTYNGVNTIERAIKSVQKQTYNNLEIKVVDDNGIGSVAQLKTEEIVRKCGDNIKYIPHKTNLNGAVARNTGIHNSNGKYIALLDDDDAFRPEKISKQIDVMEELDEDYGLCYTGMMIHFQNGRTIEQITNYEGYIFDNAIMREVKAQTSEFLIRKSCLSKLKGFDESFSRHQDWEFFDRMAFYYKIAVVKEVCVDRYIYKRTAAKNPIQYEHNRLHYLSKMKPFIDTLEVRKRKELYNFHYRSIAKEYIKQKKINRGLMYLIKSGSPIRTIRGFVNEYKSSSVSLFNSEYRRTKKDKEK